MGYNVRLSFCSKDEGNVLHIKNHGIEWTPEVEALIEFAVQDLPIDLSHTGISVYHSETRGYRGLAWTFLPKDSEWNGTKGIFDQIQMWIGDDERFPTDNMKTTKKKAILSDWLPGHSGYTNGEGEKVQLKGWPTPVWIDDRAYHIARQGVKAEAHCYCKDEDGECDHRYFMYVFERMPYGGKSAPYHEFLNWREALVTVMAHEAQHIKQYQTFGAPRSEVECERVADTTLRKYRVHLGEQPYTAKESEYNFANPDRMKKSRKVRGGTVATQKMRAAK
jgi:hypothetical protein